MARTPTFNTTFDSCTQLRMKTITQDRHLDKEFNFAVYNWSMNGRVTASVSIIISRPEMGNTAKMTLEYYATNEKRKYSIQLVSLPSNLGKGRVWYFVCPVTFKRCRILYRIDSNGYFLHRLAYQGMVYESQTQSKYYRYLEQTLGRVFKSDRLAQQLYSKGFRKFYNGKPTKRYKRIMGQMLNNAEALEIERSILGVFRTLDPKS
jgi:hypothetical protein